MNTKIYTRARTIIDEKSCSEAQPLFSIITVVFNAESHIEKTLQSVINQSCKNFEYIIIDGGSTDKTLEIITKYENKINCLISENDNGIYDAMNKGIANSKGKYVFFLNAGDVFYENKTLEVVVSFLNNNCSIYLFNVLTTSEKIIKPNKFLLFFPYKLPTYHQGIFYKNNILEKTNFDVSWKLIADYVNYMQISKKNIPKICNFIVSVYDVNGVSSDTKLLNKEMYKYYLLQKHCLYYIFRLLLSLIKKIKQ